ncbi:MAG: hypothetical protein K9L30_14055 [Desulfobacterales bacterium]|nr:hypothetical protein [Desulfobacterales bacterium]
MNHKKNTSDIIKKCPVCSFRWADREQFLSDPDIESIGYQFHFKNLQHGYFLFNHSCKGTLALPVSIFTDLYEGPVFSEKLTGSDECLNLCFDQFNVDPCPAKCECAFVREIIQIIKKWPKNR